MDYLLLYIGEDFFSINGSFKIAIFRKESYIKESLFNKECFYKKELYSMIGGLGNESNLKIA